MKRRVIAIFAGVLSVMLLLSACGGNGQDQSKQQQTVIVGVYGGDWEKNIKPILEKFEKDTGIKVQTVSGADSEWFTKLKASNGKIHRMICLFYSLIRFKEVLRQTFLRLLMKIKRQM